MLLVQLGQYGRARQRLGIPAGWTRMFALLQRCAALLRVGLRCVAGNRWPIVNYDLVGAIVAQVNFALDQLVQDLFLKARWNRVEPENSADLVLHNNEAERADGETRAG